MRAAIFGVTGAVGLVLAGPAAMDGTSTLDVGEFLARIALSLLFLMMAFSDE